MDIYTTLLIDDDVRKAMEASYHEDKLNEEVPHNILFKILDKFQSFINIIYGLIVKLINNFTSIFNRANKSVRSFSNRIIISDIHGYFEYIKQGTDLLVINYGHLKKIRELDMNIVKEVSMIESIKEKMKDMAIRSKSEMTTRQYYEDIHRHFKEVDQCSEALDRVIAQANEDRVVTPIKRYTKDNLEKELNIPLQRIIRNLKDLKDDVQNAKETYAERKRMYKFMHKNDIDRTNKLFVKTSEAIKQSEQIEELYVKTISYVEEVATEQQ